MAAPDTNLLQSSEWQHVLSSYGRPGVGPACVLLQDVLGVDVLVMLHLGYVCKKHKLTLPETQVEAADAVVRDWRNLVVQPLRAARRAIPKEDPVTRSLRASIQQVELEAEQYALVMLAALPVWTGEPLVANTGSCAQLVATFYAKRSGCVPSLHTDGVKLAIQLLDQAVF